MQENTVLEMDISEYYEQAQKCVDGDGCSGFIEAVSGHNVEVYEKCLKDKDCDELIEFVSNELGIDPAITLGTIDCIRSKDAGTCAKISATIAAGYGCTAITGGAGAPVCSALAPIVVETIWPIVQESYSSAKSMGKAFVEGLKDIGKTIASAFGYSKSTNNLPLSEWEFAVHAEGIKQYKEIFAKCEEAILLSMLKTKRKGHVPIARSPKDIERDKLLAWDYLTRMFSRTWKTRAQIYIVATRSNAKWMDDDKRLEQYKVHFELPESGAAKSFLLQENESMLVAPAMPYGWDWRDKQWSPLHFHIVHGPGPARHWMYQEVSDAFSVLFNTRVAGMQEAMNKAIGHVVAESIVENQGLERRGGLEKKTGGFNWMLWGAVGIGAVMLYKHRKTLF